MEEGRGSSRNRAHPSYVLYLVKDRKLQELEVVEKLQQRNELIGFVARQLNGT